MASLARTALAVLLLCAARSVPVARAQSDALQLSWQAPDGCPTEAEVLAEARRVVGAAAEASAPISVRATVEQREGKYALHLITSYRGQRGERTLLASECKALMQSVTLVLGVLLGRDDVEADPQGSQSSVGEELGGSADPAHASEAPAAVEPAATGADSAPATAASDAPTKLAGEVDEHDEHDEREDHDERDDHDDAGSADAGALEPPGPRAGVFPFSLLLGAGLHAGLLPELAPAVVLGLELGLEALSIGLQLSGSPALGGRPAPGVHTQLDGAGLALRGCYGWALSPAAGGLCAGVRGHALRGRASGPASLEGSAVAPWYALSAGGYLSWPRASALRLRLWADAAVSLDRPRFVVERLGSVHRVAAVVGELGLVAVWSP